MNKARRKFYLFAYMARWSSGQDAALSRRKHGFDSRTDCEGISFRGNPRFCSVRSAEISAGRFFGKK